MEVPWIGEIVVDKSASTIATCNVHIRQTKQHENERKSTAVCHKNIWQAVASMHMLMY